MKLEYGLFMAESEGLLNTHESKVQRMLRDLKVRYELSGGNPTVSEGYFDKFGLTYESLTGEDLRRIAKVVETGRL